MTKKRKIASTIIISVVALIILFVFVRVNREDAPITFGILCAAPLMLAVYCLSNIETLFRVPLELYRGRDTFFALVKNDFQARFAGNIFGVFWAFVNPIITMVLYWFVFQVGLKSGNTGDYPFILFLMSGLVPWFYYSEALNGATSSLLEYSYLVKKMVFNVGILPVIKVCSALIVHLCFLSFTLVIASVYGFYPSLYTLQLIYYIACLAILVLGFAYFTAACTAFFRDMTQIVNIIQMIGMWATPIMWDARDKLPPSWLVVFKLNPVYYIVDGFRDSICAHTWFWEKPIWTVYFWVFIVAQYIFGVKFFNRLKVHFSDVL